MDDLFSVEQKESISETIQKVPKGTKISFKERQLIESLSKSGYGCTAIAQKLGREVDTIRSEVKRRSDGIQHYNAEAAQKEVDSNRPGNQVIIELDVHRVEIIKRGFSLNWTMRKICREAKVSYYSLRRYMDSQQRQLFKVGTRIKTDSAVINSLQDKIESLQQQIDIIFDILKEKK